MPFSFLFIVFFQIPWFLDLACCGHQPWTRWKVCIVYANQLNMHWNWTLTQNRWPWKDGPSWRRRTSGSIAAASPTHHREKTHVQDWLAHLTDYLTAVSVCIHRSVSGICIIIIIIEEEKKLMSLSASMSVMQWFSTWNKTSISCRGIS